MPGLRVARRFVERCLSESWPQKQLQQPGQLEFNHPHDPRYQFLPLPGGGGDRLSLEVNLRPGRCRVVGPGVEVQLLVVVVHLDKSTSGIPIAAALMAPEP